MKKPILCLDFDGVVHSYLTPWKGADVIPDPPVDGAVAFMLEALQHFDVVIFSSRSNQTGGLKAMQRWLYKHSGGAWYESPAGPGLEDVRFVTEKPPALVTLDDRALTFTGQWPAVQDLLKFQPWNKRSPTAPEAAPGPAEAIPLPKFDGVLFAEGEWIATIDNLPVHAVFNSKGAAIAGAQTEYCRQQARLSRMTSPVATPSQGSDT